MHLFAILLSLCFISLSALAYGDIEGVVVDTETIYPQEQEARSFLDWHELYYDPDLKIPFGTLGRFTYILDSPDNFDVKPASIGFDQFYLKENQLLGERGGILYLLKKKGDAYGAQKVISIETNQLAELVLTPDPDIPWDVPITKSGSSNVKEIAQHYMGLNDQLGERNRMAIFIRGSRADRWGGLLPW